MSTKSLTEAFEVKPKINTSNENVKDYDVFGDKGLLEEIRVKIGGGHSSHAESRTLESITTDGCVHRTEIKFAIRVARGEITCDEGENYFFRPVIYWHLAQSSEKTRQLVL